MNRLVLNDQKESTPYVGIFTLGEFMVRNGDTILSQSSKRSYKLWDLFKYFLTKRGKRIPSELIVDTLWPDSENSNPKLALYDLTYRLRDLFGKGFPPNENPLHIEFIQGSYLFNLKENCRVDVDEFQSLSSKAAQMKLADPAQAMDIYRQAISLYKGTYLSDSSHKEWLLKARYHYGKLYLTNLLELMKLLKARHNYHEIIQLCENAFQIDNFLEEKIHFNYIEALAEKGEIGTALNHYEFITSVLYQEIGVNPSTPMRDLYRRIKSDTEPIETDLQSVWSRLKEQQVSREAFICDRDYFRLLYRLDMRRSERTGRINPLGLLTITRKDYGLPDQKILESAIAHLKQVLLSTLRMSDTICQWNQAQILILFSDLDHDSADLVLNRIKMDFADSFKNKNVVLRGQIQALLPWK